MALTDARTRPAPSLGVERFLPKPYTLRELAAHIMAAVAPA